MSDSRPIGVFDSGIGGLTVIQALVKVLPHESFIYFGDTARVPYGEKSPETIVRYSLENADVLLEQGIKALVVACNTASAYALEALQHHCPVPVIGVIEAGIARAVEQTGWGHIAILGTKGTVASGVYQRGILSHIPDAEILAISCPLLVPLIEEQLTSHPATQMIIRHYLEPLRERAIDTLLLGCTHYPLLREAIQKEIGEAVAVIDSGTACAKQLSSLLQDHGLNNSEFAEPNYLFLTSDDREGFLEKSRRVFGEQPFLLWHSPT